MSAAPLLLEIGCEEIPARMIRAATDDLRRRVTEILSRAGLDPGPAEAWGGPRRLAVRVAAVAERQPDRDERLTGPPAAVAFDESGAPTPAAAGFAKKHGIDPAELTRVETARGVYAGIRRRVPGRSLDELLAEELPGAVAGMPFPKTMRWAEGKHRWVRPVHWVVALHGERVIELTLFDVCSGGSSRGHRFLSEGPVPVPHADRYAEALAEARVIVDPVERRDRIADMLQASANELGGRLHEDPALLDEVADLVEWPALVPGRFDPGYLELPRELLATTLRYHQKCFSVIEEDGRPLAAFLAIANLDRDPAGHVRRGNEWVVGGRLEDARFFWNEDRKRPLAERGEALAGVTFHAQVGSYADKAARLTEIAARVGERAGLAEDEIRAASRAAGLAKHDLVTGTVGEFPELQGIAGGLLLRDSGSPEAEWRAVYEHYRPEGPDDPIPSGATGCAVSAADKLDSLARLVAAGEAPSGSRDPFGLRRAANGLFRIVLERGWPIGLRDLVGLTGEEAGELASFLRERLGHFLRERGASNHEVRAVLGAAGEIDERPLPDVVARLEAIGGVREREDFRHLVELTKRVANILRKNDDRVRTATSEPGETYDDPEPTVGAIERGVAALEKALAEHADRGEYAEVVDRLATLVGPMDAFFDKALVIDPGDPRTTSHRLRVLLAARDLLTRHFDISELAGEADRRS